LTLMKLPQISARQIMKLMELSVTLS